MIDSTEKSVKDIGSLTELKWNGATVGYFPDPEIANLIGLLMTRHNLLIKAQAKAIFYLGMAVGILAGIVGCIIAG